MPTLSLSPPFSRSYPTFPFASYFPLSVFFSSNSDFSHVSLFSYEQSPRAAARARRQPAHLLRGHAPRRAAARLRGSSDGAMGVFLRRSRVPLGLPYFPEDIIIVPSSWGRTLGPVKFERWHKVGGHFAAHEEPELLIDDVRKTFGKNGIYVTIGK